MKKVEFLVLHLGYGGIEKAVSDVANMLKDEYEVSILAFYRLYDQPVFKIDPSIKIKYLYETDLPLRVKKYNQELKAGKVGLTAKDVWKDYIIKGKSMNLFNDIKNSFSIYFQGGRLKKLRDYLLHDQKDIYISTRYEISEVLAQYGSTKAKRYAWEHNHPHGNYAYMRKVFQASKNLDNLICVSNEITNMYNAIMDRCVCNCIHIPNVVNENKGELSDYQNNQIVLVGRLEQEKGIEDALEVVERLQRKNIDFTFDIIGEGPLKESLIKKAKELNVDERVNFHGFVKNEEINDIYQHACVCLMTSYTESFALVVVEAMRMGIPCVAFSSAEGVNEIIDNGNNGFIIQNRDINKMANQVETLLKDRTLLAEVGKNAANTAKKYTPDKILPLWKELLG